MLTNNHNTNKTDFFSIYLVLILVIIAGGLWIDAVTGFVVFELGVDLKLSLLYKMVLILIILLVLVPTSLKTAITLLFILIALLIPAYTMLIRFGRLDFFIKDVAIAIKIFVPLMVFSFFAMTIKTHKNLVKKWGNRALWINFIGLNVNLFIGALGFGYKSYKVGDGGFGVNGYYVAGNELGGVFVLLFSFALARVWDLNRRYYILLAMLTIFWGILIATKTTLLASLILVFIVPIISERNRLFSLTKLKVLLFFLMLLVTILVIVFVFPLFSQLALWDRLQWIYQSKGLVGLIFSGREIYSKELLSVFENYFGPLQWLFGAGISGISQWASKYTAEIDFIDVFIWFGCFGLFVVLVQLSFFFLTSYKGLKLASSEFAAAAFTANVVLLFLAFFSGHILTSGMLGFTWALLNALVLIDINKFKEIRELK